MINFSFSSVLMTILVSSFLFILVGFCFHNNRLLTSIGYKLIGVFCVISILRFLIPLEMPFTRTLRLPKAVSDIMIVFTRSYGTWKNIDISFGTIFCVIWGLGILVWGVNHVYHCRKALMIAKDTSTDITTDPACAASLRAICTEKQRKKLRIFLNPDIDTPLITGLWNPMILLPTDIDLSDTHTLYALRHEICHYTHHDLWIKLAIHILTIIYWWNPACFLLRNHVDLLLEMRVDDTIFSDTDTSAADYVNSLLYFAKGTDNKKKAPSLAIGLLNGKHSKFFYRIQRMQSRACKPRRLVSLTALAVFLSVYMLSYCYTWEVYYTEPEVAESCITLSDDNCYAIVNEEGRYDIYLTHDTYYDDTFYLETVDILDYFPVNMRIYFNEEEYYEENP